MPATLGWGIATPTELLQFVAISNTRNVSTFSKWKEFYLNALTCSGLVFTPIVESQRGAAVVNSLLIKQKVRTPGNSEPKVTGVAQCVAES